MSSITAVICQGKARFLEISPHQSFFFFFLVEQILYSRDNLYGCYFYVTYHRNTKSSTTSTTIMILINNIVH